MPGPQPRRDPLARLMSAARRRATGGKGTGLAEVVTATSQGNRAVENKSSART